MPFHNCYSKTTRKLSFVGLNFIKFPVTNRTTFSEISGKEDDVVRFAEIFGNVLPGISVPF